MKHCSPYIVDGINSYQFFTVILKILAFKLFIVENHKCSLNVIQYINYYKSTKLLLKLLKVIIHVHTTIWQLFLTKL